MAVKSINNPNSLLQFSSYQPEYVGRPVDRIGQMIGKLDDNNRRIVDTANAIDLAMANDNIDPADRAIVERQREAFDEGIRNISNSGDYTLAEARIKNLAKGYQGNKEYHSAIARRADYDNYRNELKQRRDSDLIDDQQFQHGMAQEFTPTVPDEYGFYSDKFGGRDYVNKFDYDKELSAITRGWKADRTKGLPQPVSDGQGNVLYWATADGKEITKEEVASSLRSNILNNPDAVAYLEESAQLRGDVAPKDLLESWIEPHVNRTAFNEDLTQFGGFGTSSTSTPDDEDSYFGKPFGGVSSTPSTDKPKPEYINTLSDALTKKERIDPSSTGFLTFGMRGGMAPSTTIPTQANVIPSYGVDDLPQESKDILNNMSMTLIGVPLDKIPKEDIELHYDNLKKYIDGAYNDIQASSKIENFPADLSRESVDELFGIKNNVLKVEDGQALISGKLPNVSIFNPETGVTMQGAEFAKEVLGQYTDGTGITINGRYTPNHGITGITNNKKFALSYQMNVGSDIYIVSGPDELKVKGVDIVPRYKLQNEIYQMSYFPGQTKEIDAPTIGGGTVKGAIAYDNSTGRDVYKLKTKDGISVTGNSPEDIIVNYREEVKKTK